MNIKIIGYILAFLGLGGLLLASDKVYQLIPAMNIIPKSVILIFSLGIVGVGIIIMISNKGGEKSIKEVPIYKGEKIVGYRRHY